VYDVIVHKQKCILRGVLICAKSSHVVIQYGMFATVNIASKFILHSDCYILMTSCSQQIVAVNELQTKFILRDEKILLCDC
jgi:hypothetical protein